MEVCFALHLIFSVDLSFGFTFLESSLSPSLKPIAFISSLKFGNVYAKMRSSTKTNNCNKKHVIRPLKPAFHFASNSRHEKKPACHFAVQEGGKCSYWIMVRIVHALSRLTLFFGMQLSFELESYSVDEGWAEDFPPLSLTTALVFGFTFSESSLPLDFTPVAFISSLKFGDGYVKMGSSKKLNLRISTSLNLRKKCL